MLMGALIGGFVIGPLLIAGLLSLLELVARRR
jgi:hypothetical protein